MINTSLEDLLGIQKNLQKQLISYFIASQTDAVFQNTKRLREKSEKEKIESLKSNCLSYQNNFKTSSKGKWVTQAEKSLKQINEKFN